MEKPASVASSITLSLLLAKWWLALCLCVFAGFAQAQLKSYNIDSSHTYPSFEADHFGISKWRGKFNSSSGKLQFDKATGQGKVEITVDMSSVDFGHRLMNSWAKGPGFFQVEKFPTAVFKGQFANFANNVPTEVVGEFTMVGKTLPLTLKINSLKCIEHPIFKRELCGADAQGNFDRSEYGLDSGRNWGFSMDILLRIQVEALAE
jgi:polyisoprenoid-binding protein YceI